MTENSSVHVLCAWVCIHSWYLAHSQGENAIVRFKNKIIKRTSSRKIAWESLSTRLTLVLRNTWCNFKLKASAVRKVGTEKIHEKYDHSASSALLPFSPDTDLWSGALPFSVRQVSNAPSFLSPETHMKDPPSLEYLTRQFKGRVGVVNTWRNVFLFKWWDSRVFPPGPGFEYLKTTLMSFNILTGMRTRNMPEICRMASVPLSLRMMDTIFQDQFPEWFAQIQLVQIRILFLRLQKFVGTGDDTQVS